MSTISSFFIDIDVPNHFLLSSGAEVSFYLSKNSCAENQPIQEFEFELTRAVQCNAVLLPLPSVKFQQGKDGLVTMKIEKPLSLEPALTECARTSIRITYWPKISNKRFCM